MSQNSKTTPIIVALIGAGASLLLGYLKYCRNPTVMPPVMPAEQRQFTGRVIDAESGNKIRGATVSLEIREVPPVLYTDSEGIFSFSLENATETVRLVIEAKGYQKYDRRIDVEASSGVEEIRLTPEPEDTPVSQSTPAERTPPPSTPKSKGEVLGTTTKSVPYAAATKSINEKSSAQFFDDHVTIAVGWCDNDRPVTLTVIATGAPKVCSNIAPMAEAQCEFEFRNYTYGVMVTAVGESSATVAVYPL